MAWRAGHWRIVGGGAGARCAAMARLTIGRVNHFRGVE
jgi:hypothetical protein